MDPITLIVSAIAIGAATGLTETATSAVKDAYSALKRMNADRYGDVDLRPIERKPDSEAKRGSLQEDLETLGAADDRDLLDAACRLIAEVRADDDTIGRVVGIDLADIEAASLNIGEVRSIGDGVRVKGAKLTGDFNVKNIQAGSQGYRRP
jgi:hypothetical protein